MVAPSALTRPKVAAIVVGAILGDKFHEVVWCDVMSIFSSPFVYVCHERDDRGTILEHGDRESIFLLVICITLVSQHKC